MRSSVLLRLASFQWKQKTTIRIRACSRKMSHPLSYWMHQRDRRQQLDSAATSNDAVRLQERRVAEVFVAFSPASLSCTAFNIAGAKLAKSQAAIKQAELGGKNMNCLSMLSTDDFTSQHYRCGCHRPPSCQEVCGPDVPIAFHGSAWISVLMAFQAFGCLKRAASCETGPELGSGFVSTPHRWETADPSKFQGTPPCKDQWVKNSAGQWKMKDRISERFCETWLNYDIWDKESLCADGSCPARGGGPTYSMELIYERRENMATDSRMFLCTGRPTTPWAGFSQVPVPTSRFWFGHLWFLGCAWQANNGSSWSLWDQCSRDTSWLFCPYHAASTANHVAGATTHCDG